MGHLDDDSAYLQHFAAAACRILYFFTTKEAPYDSEAFLLSWPRAAIASEDESTDGAVDVGGSVPGCDIVAIVGRAAAAKELHPAPSVGDAITRFHMPAPYRGYVPQCNAESAIHSATIGRLICRSLLLN